MKTLISIMIVTLILASDVFAVSKLNKGDTAWMIVATTLVMLMTPGLGYFYSGMVRKYNVVATIMHSYMKLCVISIVWLLCGYSLAFGPSINGIIGNLDMIGFNEVGVIPCEAAPTIPHILFATFQGLFAVITTAIITGSFAERVRLFPVLLFSIIWVLFVYAPIAHWVWGGGWIETNLGALDFAGGAVVHISSGVAGLIASLSIGSRQSSFEKINKFKPHNLPMTILGAALLWFGWFGFNAGSVFGANELTGLVVANTNIAAAAGTLGWFFIEYIHRNRPTSVGAISGSIAGLVAITPAAGFVTPIASFIIGIFGGLFCYWAVCILKPKFKYDDSLDAFGIHGIGGMWGALATGLFANININNEGNNGLFYGNPSLVLVQLASILIVVIYSAIITYIILFLLKKIIQIRVSTAEENKGLDKSQHGEVGYTIE